MPASSTRLGTTSFVRIFESLLGSGLFQHPKPRVKLANENGGGRFSIDNKM
jgi:hypothetical protein